MLLEEWENIAALNSAVSMHTNCKMPTEKEDREKQKRGCGTR